MTRISEARWHEEEKAITALHAIKPEDSDAVIASIIADYQTMKVHHQPPYRLGIDHDLSRSTERRVERLRKKMPGYEYPFKYGLPVPLRFDWEFENKVGITTDDRDAARRWAIEALLLGYTVYVFSHRNLRRGTVSLQSIAQIREDQAHKARFFKKEATAS